jgi:hypothetical protein
MDHRLLSFFIFVITFSLSVLIYFQFSSKIVMRKNYRIYGILLSFYIITLAFLLSTGEHLYIFALLPFLYIFNTLFWRVVMFNSITKRMGINELSCPFDPLILYPGMLFAYWDKEKRQKLTVLEVIFSFIILILPLLEFTFLGNLLLDCPTTMRGS